MLSNLGDRESTQLLVLMHEAAPLRERRADAEVILVVESGQTHRGAAIKAKEQFVQNNIDIAGVVLNKVSPRDVESYYTYHSYYPS